MNSPVSSTGQAYQARHDRQRKGIYDGLRQHAPKRLKTAEYPFSFWLTCRNRLSIFFVMKKSEIAAFIVWGLLPLTFLSCAKVQATKTEHPSGKDVMEDHEDVAGRKEAARHFMVAQNLLKAGDLDKAENEINKVLSMAPDQPVPHLLAGDIYSAKGDFAKALQEYERAKDEDKTKAFPYAKIGEACVRLNMKDKALEAFQSAVKLDPNVPALHKRLGDLYKDSGMEAEARAEYGRAAELEKSRRESASGEGPEVSTAKAGKNPEPGDSPVVRVMKLGDEFLKQELWDLAADEYAIAVRLEPQNPIVHQKLGDAFQRKGMLTEAAGQYEEVIRLKPDLPLGYLGLGAVRSRMFKVKEAISLFQKGLSFAPDFSLLHFELAMAYTKEDNLDQAISELEKAVSLDKERRPQPREILNRLIQEKAAEKGFVTMQSELFVLKYDPSEKKSFIDYTLKALHEACKKLEKDMAYKPKGEVVVKLYPDIRAFHGAASTPDWFFGGVASAKNNMVMLATPKREVNIAEVS